jgi:predicted methyltransferase
MRKTANSDGLFAMLALLILNNPTGSPMRTGFLTSLAFAMALAIGVSLASDHVQAASTPAVGTLDWAVAGDWRPAEEMMRDKWRHPVETLTFFGIKPSGKIAEIWPGTGYYTQILAPWVNANGGGYRAVLVDLNSDQERIKQAQEKFRSSFSDSARYGRIEFGDLSDKDSDGIAPPGSLDAVLTFRNIHNWMKAGFSQEAFNAFFAALKPGGILGVVEHRMPPSRQQDAKAESGYVQEAHVKILAELAGFIFVASSEINANPADTADHPFGVWTLAPIKRRAAPGETPSADFDHAKYDAIGESDRMTLLFRKP